MDLPRKNATRPPKKVYKSNVGKHLLSYHNNHPPFCSNGISKYILPNIPNNSNDSRLLRKLHRQQKNCIRPPTTLKILSPITYMEEHTTSVTYLNINKRIQFKRIQF